MFNAYVSKLLNEKAFNPSDFNVIPASTPVSVVVGRFNPWTKGHNTLTDEAKYPVVIGLVKSKKSSLDKERNPFDFNLQKEIIKRSNNSNIIDIVELPSGSVPFMISKLRDLGYEPKELWAGTDRAMSYGAQIEKYADDMNSDIKLNILERKEDDTSVAGISATKVRAAIRANEYESVKNMMDNVDPDLFRTMQQQMRIF